MHELQTLIYILNKRDLAFLLKNGIDETHFFTYKDQFLFIKKHFEKYGIVPDITTFVDAFEGIDVDIEIEESPKYFVNKLRDAKITIMSKQAIQNFATDFNNRKQSEDVVRNMKNTVDILMKEIMASQGGEDWATNGDERWERYLQSETGVSGLPTGLDFIDEQITGIKKTDFIAVMGYLGEGKSWLILLMALACWNAGAKVLLFSLEMNHQEISTRLDTLNGHFLNKFLNTGSLMGEWKTKYKDYLNQFKEGTNTPSFKIFTAKDLAKGLDTVVLEAMIQDFQPDVVFIDQLSLMEHKEGRDRRERYENTTRKLKLIAGTKEVPIVLAVQANRESAKTKDKEEANDVPDTFNVADAIGVMRDVDKAISIKRFDNKETGDKLAKIGVIKGRSGGEDPATLCQFDVNRGIIRKISKDIDFVG